MRKSFVPRVVALMMVCTIVAGTSASQQNLIVNPCFEEANGDNPAGWRTQRWGGRGDFTYAQIGRTGERSVMISSDAGADIGWSQNVGVRPFCRTGYRDDR